MQLPDELLAALQAALDETERLAVRAVRRPRDRGTVATWTAGARGVLVDDRGGIGELYSAGIAEHIAYNDPAAVLRRVAADRRVLARHPGATATDECPGCGAWLDGTWCTPPGALCPELVDLAERLGVTIQEDANA